MFNTGNLTTQISTDYLYIVYCLHIPSIFTGCQFLPILRPNRSLENNCYSKEENVRLT